MKFYCLILVMLFLLSCDNIREEVRSDDPSASIKAHESLASDGAWCWFSDPRAVYHKGNREQVYFGYINSRGDVMIGSRDMPSGESRSFTLHDTLEVDDHNVPSILILPSGHLLAFYNEHNGHVFMRRSIQPEDISSWDPEKIICQATDNYDYCYSNPVRLSEENGRIYLIGRKVGPTRSFEHWWHYIKYSDDDGHTWGDEYMLLDNLGRANPPYLKVTTNHSNRIDFLFTDGHPKIGSDVSTYHMYYSQDTFFQTNGDVISLHARLPVSIPLVHKVYDAQPSNIRSWIWDITLVDESPVITYARYPSENDHIYHYAYWENDSWQDYEIVNSGAWMASLRQNDLIREAHYSGGIVLNQTDPTVLFLSRNISGKFEIERRTLLSNGTWSASPITENSTANNVRPYVVAHTPPDKTILLWMHGLYRHYTEYDMEIKMAIIQ